MSKFKVTQKIRDFANDLWEGQLSISELATKYETTTRTISRWKKRPEIQEILRQINEDRRTAIKRTALKYAERATKSLVKLTETVTIKTEQDEEQRFKYSPETVRKAACDILELAGLSKNKEMPEDSKKDVKIEIIEEIVGEPDEKLAERADRISKRAAKIRDRFRQN